MSLHERLSVELKGLCKMDQGVFVSELHGTVLVREEVRVLDRILAS